MGKRRAEASDLICDNQDDWERLKDHAGLVIVDVFSRWAGPCHVMKPVIIKIKLKVLFMYSLVLLLVLTR